MVNMLFILISYKIDEITFCKSVSHKLSYTYQNQMNSLHTFPHIEFKNKCVCCVRYKKKHLHCHVCFALQLSNKVDNLKMELHMIHASLNNRNNHYSIPDTITSYLTT